MLFSLGVSVIYVRVPLEITDNGHFQEPSRCNCGDDMVGNRDGDI